MTANLYLHGGKHLWVKDFFYRENATVHSVNTGLIDCTGFEYICLHAHANVVTSDAKATLVVRGTNDDDSVLISQEEVPLEPSRVVGVGSVTGPVFEHTPAMGNAGSLVYYTQLPRFVRILPGVWSETTLDEEIEVYYHVHVFGWMV